MKRVTLAALLTMVVAAIVAPAAVAWVQTDQLSALGSAMRTAGTQPASPEDEDAGGSGEANRPEDFKCAGKSCKTTTTTTTTTLALVVPEEPTEDPLSPSETVPESEIAPESGPEPQLQSIPVERGKLVALTPASIRDENPYIDLGDAERISLGPVEGIAISFRAAAEQLGSHWFLSLIVGFVAAAMSLTVVERRAERVSA